MTLKNGMIIAKLLTKVKRIKRGKKGEKRGKSREKNFIFFLFVHFYTGRKNFKNKYCLFYAKFS